jgi:hypothetical protein
MHLPYLVKLDGTTPLCIFFFYIFVFLCFLLILVSDILFFLFLLKYEENMYKCYYCGIKESPLQSIIEHCKLSHGAFGYFFLWRTTYSHLIFIVLKVISFILVTFRSLKKILTEVLLYWSIQLLFVGFLIKYVS